MSAKFAWDENFAQRHPGLTPEWAKEVAHLELIRSQCKDVEFINSDLERTRKALIILGCSFADGQASIPDEIISDLTPIYHPIDNSHDYTSDQYTDSEIAELAIKHKLPVYPERINKIALTVDIYNTELHNSWGSQVGRMLNNEYTVINCADRGAGNNSAVKKLYRYPIDWQHCEEVLVIWSVCDYTRWSMLHSLNQQKHKLTGDSRTFWWIPERPDPADKSKYLNWMFSEFMYSTPLFFLDEYVDNCVQIKTFTKQFDRSNIVVMPAFTQLPENDPNMEWHYYLSQIAKNSGKELAKIIKSRLLTEHLWDVDGYDTLARLCMAQSTDDYHDWQHYIGKTHGIGNEWISACDHPTHKSQSLIAQRLHKHITCEVL